MALNCSVTEDFKVIIKDGTKKIDEVGAFDSADAAEIWGAAVCAKYNSPEYADTKYPNELAPIE